MNGSRIKRWAARWLYRWTYSQGIIGAVFSALTFAGVFALVLGPSLNPLGFTYTTTIFLLLGFVAVIFFGLGFFLDRVAKFWAAQAEISVVRNPYLVDRLYQKELLTMTHQHLPVMYALRSLSRDPRIVVELDAAISRLEATVRNKRWTIREGEDVYEDSA